MVVVVAALILESFEHLSAALAEVAAVFLGKIDFRLPVRGAVGVILLDLLFHARLARVLQARRKQVFLPRLADTVDIIGIRCAVPRHVVAV